MGSSLAQIFSQKLSNIAHDFEQVAWHTSARCLLSHQAAKAGLLSHQINVNSRSALQPIYFQLKRLAGSGSQVLSTSANWSLTLLMGYINRSCFGQLGPNLSRGDPGGSPAPTEVPPAAASLVSPCQPEILQNCSYDFFSSAVYLNPSLLPFRPITLLFGPHWQMRVMNPCPL